MAASILIYGSPDHPSLTLIHQHLLRRAKREVVYLVQETFPVRVGLFLKVGAQGSMLLPEEADEIFLDDLVSVCLDQYYISPIGLGQENFRDQQYVQAESWAALIAMFYQLSERALVANHVLKRDYMTSRWGELCFLSSHGLEVPRALVTSSPEHARAFYDDLKGEVIFKNAGSNPNFRPLVPEELDRFERLPLSPVHFEEAPPVGSSCRAVIIGSDVRVLPGDYQPPEDVLKKCLTVATELNLVLGEIPLRRQGDRWLATGIRRFPSADVLSEPSVMESVAHLLETGKQS